MRIVRKKKGKEIYYYLQHTFRENGKVKAKEVYLGKSIPKNIEEIKQNFSKELKKNLYEKFEKIKQNFQSEWKRIPESVRKKQLEEISIAFTYNTNAIEGSTITLEEAREIIHDKISPNKPLRDVKETEAHSKVFLEMLESKERISNELLLRWHQEIFKEVKPDISGKYRDYLVRVGSHLAHDWQEVKELMNKLIIFISKSELHPIELSAVAHFRFEKIHPFGDGNGRIGRLLLNYILWRAGYPMLIIEYKNRKSYYKAFQKDETHFVSYLIKRYLSVHKRKFSSSL
jgi:Fic family protein